MRASKRKNSAVLKCFVVAAYLLSFGSHIYEIFLILNILLVLAGCLPCPGIGTPEHKGRVVDKTNDAPIVGAKIYFKRFPDKFVRSDIRGNYHIYKYTPISWQPLCGEPALPRGILIFEANGYKTLKIEVSSSSSTLDGEVKLDHDNPISKSWPNPNINTDGQ